MLSNSVSLAARSAGSRSAVAFALALSLLTGGCSLSPLARHTAAFSKATVLVVDNSEDAYRAAMRLRQQEQFVAAVYAYDSNPSWNPYTDPRPLLTHAQLAARIKVLDGLKLYARTLVQLTGKRSAKDQASLDAAAQAAGSNLRGLNQAVATDLNNDIPGFPVMSAANADVVSTAVRALADYLTARTIKRSLPKVTQDMNPTVEALCNLLDSDITILRRQADVDYKLLIQDQDQFIRHTGTGLNPVQHRDEVGRLVQMAEQQKANDAMLTRLQDAIKSLALTHQALAAAVQGNNPATISEKIAELTAAGEDLGTFYKSLPTS